MSSTIDTRLTGGLPVAAATKVVPTATNTTVTVEKAEAVLTADRGILSFARRFFSAITFGLVSAKASDAFTANLDKFAKAQLAMADKATNAAVRAARPVRAEAIKSLVGRVVALSGDNTASFAAGAKKLMAIRLEKSGLNAAEIADAHKRFDAEMQEVAVKKFVSQIDSSNKTGDLRSAIDEEGQRLQKAGIFSTFDEAVNAIELAFATRLQAQFPADQAGNEAFAKKIENIRNPENKKAIVAARQDKEKAKLAQLTSKRDAIYDHKKAVEGAKADAWKTGLSELEQAYLIGHAHDEFPIFPDLGHGRFVNGTLGKAQTDLLKAIEQRAKLERERNGILTQFGACSANGLLDDSGAFLNMAAVNAAIAAKKVGIAELFNQYCANARAASAEDEAVKKAREVYYKVRQELIELNQEIGTQQTLTDNIEAIVNQVGQEIDRTVGCLEDARVRSLQNISFKESLENALTIQVRAKAAFISFIERGNYNAAEINALKVMLGDDTFETFHQLCQDDPENAGLDALVYVRLCEREINRLEGELNKMNQNVNLD